MAMGVRNEAPVQQRVRSRRTAVSCSNASSVPRRLNREDIAIVGDSTERAGSPHEVAAAQCSRLCVSANGGPCAFVRAASIAQPRSAACI